MAQLDKMITKRNGEYCVQEQSLQSVCEQYKTPFFLYDLDLVAQQYNSLYKYIPWPNLKIYYAMKANYNVDILRCLQAEKAYVDTVSPAEVLLALKLGYAKENIMFTANHMTDEEMHAVREYGVLFNIDSISRLQKYAQAYPGTSVCVRFNSGVVAGENEKVQTGGDHTKFGILLEDASEVKRIATQYGLQIIGLHMHTGSGIAETQKVYQGMQNLLQIATRQTFPHLKFIDFGGGFKAPYHPDEAEIDYKLFGEKIVQIFDGFCREYGETLELYFEPGKYVVAEAGCLLMRVNTIKKNGGHTIIGTDSGFPQCIRPVFYGAYHHIINISNPNGSLQKYDVYGNICETGDCFAKERTLSEVREGDYLALLNAGAYCFSMASIYNLRPLPSEIVVVDQKVKPSREQLTIDAFVKQLCAAYNN